MDVRAVGKVLVSDRDVEIVATEDGDSNVERRLVDFDGLTDEVDIEEEKPIVKQSIGKHLVFPTEMFPSKKDHPLCHYLIITCYFILC